MSDRFGVGDVFISEELVDVLTDPCVDCIEYEADNNVVVTEPA